MMERYKRANEGVHAPDELKWRTVRDSGKHRSGWPAAIAAVVVTALLCGTALWSIQRRVTPAAETEPPQVSAPAVQTVPGGTVQAVPLSMTFEPDYTAQYDGTPLDGEYLSAVRGFAARAGAALLDGDDSAAYSPTALYTALSMTAELTEGEDLNALLDLLGSEGTDSLRQYSGVLWRSLCADPDLKEPGKVTVANSLWLNREVSFRTETLQELADHYYVSSHIGDMMEEIPREVSKWVKEQTNGLLDFQMEPNPDTLAALLSAIYFYDEWAEPFNPNETETHTFWTSDGGHVPANFMERTEEEREYYKGKGVTACAQYFQNGGKMLFILPDEEAVPVDVLSDPSLLAGLLDWEGLEKETGTVEWAIPRFTLSSTLDLEDGLTSLGLGGFFDPMRNSLPKLSDETEAHISQAQQGTAIAIDERGCEAASYVAILSEKASALSFELVQMNLNRPFLFAILSENDVPLFLGVVNDPGGRE